ncbi:hypothetical protein [Sphingomonas sp. Leaf34]|uniref:hypothetical protein n=1 Tax=Sphingomonas sp. Leaf34 TaxID=1736216 RepID=UPI000A96519C|nr:hypothetical protein [Sphingomonas sp. Leaf34]
MNQTPQNLTIFRRFVRAMNSSPTWREADDRDYKRVDGVFFGLASLAAVGAYSFQYVQPFVDPQAMFGGGLFVVMGLATRIAMPTEGRAAWMLWLPLIMVVAGGGILGSAGFRGLDAAQWNDRRCAEIQTSMLKPVTTTRSELASVFEAMKCRPQGATPRDPTLRVTSPKSGSPFTVAELAAHQAFLRKALSDELSLTVPTAASQPSLGTPAAPAAASKANTSGVHSDDARR